MKAVGRLSAAAGEAPSGPFVGEKALLRNLKDAFLVLAGAAVQRFGAKVKDEQEALIALADVAIGVFAIESAVLRAEKIAASGNASRAEPPRRPSRRSRSRRPRRPSARRGARRSTSARGTRCRCSSPGSGGRPGTTPPASSTRNGARRRRPRIGALPAVRAALARTPTRREVPGCVASEGGGRSWLAVR